MPQSGARYMQIAAHFRQLINAQRLLEGDQLPTDEEVGRLFNVSRITARQAMSELVQSGYIERIQGKGTFVRVRKADMQLNCLKGFTEEMQAYGLKTFSRLHSYEVVSCPADVAQRLRVDNGSKLHCLVRVRYAGDIPMAIEQVMMPFYLCPELEEMNLEGSLYHQLLERKGWQPVRASQNIEAGLVNHEYAGLLRLREGSPALVFERVSYLEDDTPMEYVVSVYRGDRYKFHVEMHREGSISADGAIKQ